MSDAEKPALDLAHLQSLAYAATLGPWDYDDVTCAIVAWNAPVYTEEDEREPRDVAKVTYTTMDGMFIAAAREAIPALIARVREVEAERDELRTKIAAVPFHDIVLCNDEDCDLGDMVCQCKCHKDWGDA